MGRPTGNGEFGPRDALHPGDHPDGDGFVFQHRPLFDVQFHEGRRSTSGRARHGAGIADALEFVAEPRFVVGGAHIERFLERHAAHVHQASEHVGLEARTLLVGEEGNGDGPLGGNTSGRECFDNLEPGEHAEVAVEAATGAHRVDMRACHDRAGIGVGTAPHSHYVAHAIDAHRHTEIVHPTHHQIATEAIGIGERQAGRAPFTVGAVHSTDGAEFVEAGAQALDIDTQRRSLAAHRPKSNAAISRSASPNARTAPSNSSAPRSAVAVVGSPM